MNTFNGIDLETGKQIEDLTDDEFIECLGIDDKAVKPYWR